MANTLRIKRRSSAGAAGAPTSLENAELAFNEADNTLYYGTGTGGAGGSATSVIAIGGYGSYATLGTTQTLTGNKTFSGTVIVPTPTANTHAATKLYVDSAVAGATIANTTVTAASYGGAGTVATFTVQADGRLTAASNTTISITASQISDRASNLVTGLTGTANEITVSNSGVGAVALSLPANVTISNNLTVTGDLIVNGNTTTLNTATLVVEDKNIVLANVASPTDITANGAGFTIKGATDKTLNWVDATDAWTSSENFDLASAKVYKIGTTDVLSSTTLGSTVVNSSLTSLGTIVTGVWNGSTVGIAYGGTGATTASGARTSLELGTIATQNANNVTITGGSIDNMTFDGGTF